MKYVKKAVGMAAAVVMSLSAVVFSADTQFVDTIDANAAEAYPVQEFLMGISDTNQNVNASGTILETDAQNGSNTEKWSLNFVSDGVFEIVSSDSGNILTAGSNGVSLAKDIDGADQRWRIDGVQKDFDGYYLYYKITNNVSGKALTYSENSGTFTLSDYSGNSYQKYKINLDGLEGFAANAMCDEGEKAGTVGGLFGQTVFASNDTEFINYLKDTRPLTIVVDGTINMQSHQKTRIRDNKTIVGAYSSGKIIDCELRTNNEYGIEGDEPSDNIIFRNIDFLAKNERGRILIQIWSSRQIWIDHCTFNSELSRDVNEVGKFIWLNTPYETYMDKKDRLRSIDYITISYCQFRNRFWTVAYGLQNDEITRDRTTLMYNWWDQCVRRCPQLGNGNAHIYNNFYTGNDNGNDQSTDQIIGGDGCNIISQNCRFQSIPRGHEIIGGGGNQPYRDDGSYYAEKSNSTPKPLNYKVSNTSKWYPGQSNYGYSLLDAYNTNGTDTKDFCLAYSGRFNSGNKIKYITDSDMQKYVSTKYECPFTKKIELKKAAAVMDTSAKYIFRNVGSGLYLEVENGIAENGANVQQGKSSNKAAYTWRLEDAGEGYYYIYSTLGDGSYCIDLPYGSTDNGTSIGLWTNDNSDARKFKFIANGDGSYTIVTKCTDDRSVFGVSGGSSEIGADVIQWATDGTDSQKWIVRMKLDYLNGEFIKDFDRFDVEHSASYSIESNLQEGALIFGDRDTTYAGLPTEFIGAEYVRMACDAKGLTEDIAELEIAKKCMLYVALDSRMTGVPEFLSDWTATELTAQSDKGVTFNVYAKDCEQGDIITLGGNGQSSGVIMYAVIAVGTADTIKGDVNGDGKINVSDVVLLQKWLFASPDTYLANWKAADLCEDERLNAFDLCLMKRLLINK